MSYKEIQRDDSTKQKKTLIHAQNKKINKGRNHKRRNKKFWS